jgi:tetratricopeptide (TPR) repeat protein
VTSLRILLRDGEVVPVIGAGVSASLADLPPWKDLIREALAYVEATNAVDAARTHNARRLVEEDKLVEAASFVAAALGAPKGDFTGWLDQVFSSPKLKHRHLLDAIFRLKAPLLLTTNYDRLLSDFAPAPIQTVTWKRPDKMLRALRTRDGKRWLFHLHGVYDEPESVIFGTLDYDTLVQDEGYRFVLQTLWTQRTLLFIGCSFEGITDPDFGRMIDWATRAFEGSPYKHYALLRTSSFDQRNAATFLNERRIQFVEYGPAHADLATFLSTLPPHPGPRVRRRTGQALGDPASSRDRSIVVLPVHPPRPVRGGLVGRSALLAEAKRALLSGQDVGLYSGLPGVGKTALAITLANDADLAGSFEDGILWADLGPTAGSHETIVPRLENWALALGVRSATKRARVSTAEMSDMLSHTFGDRRMLLVIDDAWEKEAALAFRVGGRNCAHLLTTRRSDIAEAFADAGRLFVPELAPADAISLLERVAPTAAAMDPGVIKLGADLAANLPLTIILIGRQLESEARRGRKRLQERFRRIASDVARLQLEVDLPPADRRGLPADVPLTLFALIQLSDDRLSDSSRRALRMLSAFPPKGNSFSEDAALYVAEISSEQLDELDNFGLLERIPDRDRYTLHQAIASYARAEREDAHVFPRMSAYFTHYVTEQGNSSGDEDIWLDSIEQEHDNLHAALTWCVETRDAPGGWRLAEALWPYWYQRSKFAEGSTWIERLLTLDSDSAELLKVKATLLNNWGNLLYNLADFAAAESLHMQSLALRRELGAEEASAGSLNNLALIARVHGEYDRAKRLLCEALALNRRFHNRFWEAINQDNLGEGEYEQAHQELAASHLEEALSLFDVTDAARDRKWGMAMAQSDLGNVLLAQGDYSRGHELHRRSLLLRHELKDRKGLAESCEGFSELARLEGDIAVAITLRQVALALWSETGDRRGLSLCLGALGALRVTSGDVRRAVRHLATSEDLRKQYHFIIPPIDHSIITNAIQHARVELGEEAFKREWDAGPSNLSNVMRDATGARLIQWEGGVETLLEREVLGNKKVRVSVRRGDA